MVVIEVNQLVKVNPWNKAFFHFDTVEDLVSLLTRFFFLFFTMLHQLQGDWKINICEINKGNRFPVKKLSTNKQRVWLCSSDWHWVSCLNNRSSFQTWSRTDDWTDWILHNEKHTVQTQSQFNIPLSLQKDKTVLDQLACVELYWTYLILEGITSPNLQYEEDNSGSVWTLFPWQDNGFHSISHYLFFRKRSVKSKITF